MPTLVSAAEYLNFSYRPDVEYVDGILVERGEATVAHGLLQAILIQTFSPDQKELGLLPLPNVRMQIVAGRPHPGPLAVSSAVAARKSRDARFRGPLSTFFPMIVFRSSSSGWVISSGPVSATWCCSIRSRARLFALKMARYCGRSLRHSIYLPARFHSTPTRSSGSSGTSSVGSSSKNSKPGPDESGPGSSFRAGAPDATEPPPCGNGSESGSSGPCTAVSASSACVLPLRLAE